MRTRLLDRLSRVVTWVAHVPHRIAIWWDRKRAIYVSEEWRATRRRVNEDL